MSMGASCCHGNQFWSNLPKTFIQPFPPDPLMLHILSINEKLPLTRVHLTQEHIWIFLDKALPSVQLSFLWCTVLWIGTTENGVRHTWMHDTLSLMNSRCLHWVLWELAKWWWFLKVWTSLALFDGIIETISMAFSRNIFQAYTGRFLKIMFSHFDKPWKAQNARAAAAPPPPPPSPL